MVTATLKTHLSESDIDKIITSTSYIRDKLIIQLLYRSGCRVSELVGIKTSDIDFERRLILIQHLKRTIKRQCSSCGIKVGRKHNFCPSCGTKLSGQFPKDTIKQRFIPFDEQTVELIQRYLDKRRVPNSRLVPLTRQAVYYIVRNAARRAGLGGSILLNLESGKRKGVSPHRFRDAFAIQALSRDPSIEGRIHLQQHLGHASFNTTEKYIKYAPKEASDWYDKVWGKKKELTTVS